MPLQVVETGLHVRVACDRCRVNTAELCGRANMPAKAIERAIPIFKKHGWHRDGAGPALTSGRWYCPDCARHQHL